MRSAGCAYAQSQTGWRLPNIKELTSLANRGTYYPAMDTTAFPGTPADSWYWSSTPDSSGAGRVWIVSFINGSVSPRVRTFTGANSGLIRLVK
jgi:hypothetical protein